MRTTTIQSAVLAAVLLLGLGAGPAAAAGAAHHPTPAPLPVTDPATLQLRYQASQQAVSAALAVAGATGDRSRQAALTALRGRNLLAFDPRGGGRAVAVIGDLPDAERIAVMVPGADTTLDGFDRPRGPGGSARALADQIGALDPTARVATVAWLGYEPPQGITLRAATDATARVGARELRATLADLRAVNPDAPISLLCHSYGSLVCAYAAPRQRIADLAVYGSPGLAITHADELSTVDRLWAGRAGGDWIRYVPPVRLAGLGFGVDPVTPAFGARPFATGAGGHGDYHLPGSVALRSLALIALGPGHPACVPAEEVAHV